MIYVFFLGSILTYEAPKWWSLLSTTNNCSFKRFHHRNLRSLSGFLWFVRNDAIRTELGVTPLSDIVRSLAETLPFAYSSSYPHIRDLCTAEPPSPIQVNHFQAIVDEPAIGRPSSQHFIPSLLNCPFPPASRPLLEKNVPSFSPFVCRGRYWFTLCTSARHAVDRLMYAPEPGPDTTLAGMTCPTPLFASPPKGWASR